MKKLTVDFTRTDNLEGQILLLHKLFLLQARDVVFLEDCVEPSAYSFTSLTKENLQLEDLDFLIELTSNHARHGDIAYQTMFPDETCHPEMHNASIEEKSKHFGNWFNMDSYRKAEVWIKENKGKTFASSVDFMQIMPYDGNAKDHLRYLEKLCLLAAKEHVFFSSYSDTHKDWLNDKAFPELLCSDTFGMCCADAESFDKSDVDLIIDMLTKFGYKGIVAWISKRRKEKPLLDYARLNPKEYAEAVAYLESL